MFTLKTVLTGAALVFAAGAAHLSLDSNKDVYAATFCSCDASAEFDPTLPVSHPINRCALPQETEVSWSGWLRGKSSSYQFHYLDLLELLSRGAEKPTPRP